MSPVAVEIDRQRDLLLERVVPVPPETLWTAWTEPEHLVQWFAPRPFETTECDIDLRPGGVFRTVMRSPAGQDSTSIGCYLEVAEHERLTWTTALGPAYRPAAEPALVFTAVIALEPVEGGTRYRAHAMHASADSRHRHDELGFHEGWGTALDQLVAIYA